jgi:prevent-host-death family protein
MTDTAWTAVEAKLRFSELLDSAVQEPQVILRHGKPAGVVIAWDTYNKRAGAFRPGIQFYLDELAELNSRICEDLDIAPRTDRIDTGALFP